MSERGSRSSGYTKEEDKFLCQVYMEVSQDPITGVHQTYEMFWDRITEAFGNGKPPTWCERSKKSLSCRLQTIEKATRKLHACIKQCESRRSSGASNDDIFNQVKEMLTEDRKYKSGWKFDHVWNIIKDFEKFQDGVIPPKKLSNPCGAGNTFSESENLTHESATQVSPSLSSFSLNLDVEDEIIGRSPSERPIGVKKAKLNRKSEDLTSTFIKTFDEGNKRLLEQLKKTSEQREHLLEIQRQNYDMKEASKEDKILYQDIKSIDDPKIRAYLESQKAEILRKRLGQQPSSSSTPMEQYLNDLSGSGGDLPDYYH